MTFQSYDYHSVCETAFKMGEQISRIQQGPLLLTWIN